MQTPLNWEGLPGRCSMYCANLPDDDWLVVCDCFAADALAETMKAAISESCAVEVPPAADPAAGTVSPETDPAQMTGDGGVVDSDPDGAYGDRVQDASTLYGLSGGHKSRLHSLTPSAESVSFTVHAQAGDAVVFNGVPNDEAKRLSRLRLWQAQR